MIGPGKNEQRSLGSNQRMAMLASCDPVMQLAIERASRAALSDASVIITGETGTGKEVVARYIHFHSSRSKNQFVAVNCAAIPEQLLESELFGHERGSFSGAVSQRIGKIELAHEGTLLLDEVSEMERGLQAKLLRAIQEREIDRVGGRLPIPVDFRIIATTNRNIGEEIEARRFRQDLYYRLNVVSLRLPSLREHPADIIPLAEYFIKQFRLSDTTPHKRLSNRAIEALLDHPWPGNIRELENTIHRAMVMSSQGIIEETDLEICPTNQMGGIESGSRNKNFTLENQQRRLSDIERDVIINSLLYNGGNRSKTSRVLGVSVRSLRNKLNTYASQGLSIPCAQ